MIDDDIIVMKFKCRLCKFECMSKQLLEQHLDTHWKIVAKEVKPYREKWK